MVAVVVAVAVAVNLGTGSAPGSPSPSLIIVARNPLLDQPAPDFTLPSLDGGTVSLADYRGRPLIINFWASWCQPCQQEFPLFVAARQRYQSAGLEILGIVHEDTAQSAAGFAAQQGAQWPLLTDPSNDAWTAYKGALLPISYYVDRDGIIRAVSYGPPPSGALEDELAKIL